MGFILLCTAVFIGDVIRRKHSFWASNLYMASLWIIFAFSIAIGLNSSLKEGLIDIYIYKKAYSFTYFCAILGCFYLLPVMLGIGKKKKPIKKENEL
jgi:TRAP-type mannitol/chloroaromatic compound transport system permease small subunit